MYNNKQFLTAFKIISIVALILGGLHFWMEYTQLTTIPYKRRPLWQNWTLALLEVVGLWWSIGYWLKQARAALITALLTVIITFTYIYVNSLEPSTVRPSYSLTQTLIDLMTALLPPLVFGWLVFRDRRAWIVMLLGIIPFGVAFMNGYYVSEFLEQLLGKRAFLTMRIQIDDRTHRYFYYLRPLFKSLILLVLFLLYSFLISGLQKNVNYLKGRSIDLAQGLSKSWATVFYLIFWIAFFSLALSTTTYQGYIVWYYQLFLRLSLVFTIYLLSLAYRDLLTTYLISRGEAPNMRYFWWVFPFTSILSWFLSLALIEKRVPLAERIQVFKKQQDNLDPNYPLRVLMLTVVILTALYNFSSIINRASLYQLVSVIVGSLISLGLIIWYLNHYSGIWGIMGIAIVQIGITCYLMTSGGEATVSPNYIYSLANALVLFPLFHLYHFQNIAVPPAESDTIEEKSPD